MISRRIKNNLLVVKLKEDSAHRIILSLQATLTTSVSMVRHQGKMCLQNQNWLLRSLSIASFKQWIFKVNLLSPTVLSHSEDQVWKMLWPMKPAGTRFHLVINQYTTEHLRISLKSMETNLKKSAHVKFKIPIYRCSSIIKSPSISLIYPSSGA